MHKLFQTRQSMRCGGILVLRNHSILILIQTWTSRVHGSGTAIDTRSSLVHTVAGPCACRDGDVEDTPRVPLLSISRGIDVLLIQGAKRSKRTGRKLGRLDATMHKAPKDGADHFADRVLQQHAGEARKAKRCGKCDRQFAQASTLPCQSVVGLFRTEYMPKGQDISGRTPRRRWPRL